MLTSMTDFADTNRLMQEQPLCGNGGVISKDDVWLGLKVSVILENVVGREKGM